MSQGSLLLSIRNALQVAKVSAVTIADASRGKLTKSICDARLDAFCRDVIRRADVHVEVVGRENVAPGEVYVMVSNHQSFYDVPVVYYALGPNIRMVGKKELFDLPLFGNAMRQAGFIEVDRKNHAQAVESMKQAKALLAHGTHLWLAPEGTRSKTGELLPFKKGAFVIAQEMKLPILPVSLKGTRDVLVAQGFRSHKGQRVRVTIHKPLRPESYAALEPRAARDAMLRDAHAAVASGL